ncbi:MAG: hydrogenase maturation nickel metallochaperone HypA [Gemmatimonadetes bacterium]|nr:hydrogenase maturation nickel metallochaperone HypA [Gemmatimonadota bacterium]NIQ54076.1 hydrogenase maturation nickel metallochaperone HypA [Gemmatimonadota bacterium]NIU74269.1 hydrogenase maturation nickel metallochaperone HypA [Gammaproteobacteria bacterium]NIX44286.1 hydrogenase maturation nickel metallochaperone HypA [Gemmatimonadota bacterium]NIY08503.1 hydrogenase maturation nickel metallochaperone HypA [Gemmatimonadota bacterium]
MHEMPATRGMLELALASMERAGAERILAIDVVVGDLTSIVDDSVQFYFDILSRGTPAAGAELRFRRESAEGRCLECGHTFDVTPPLVRTCPACDALALRVTGGREFYVDSIEVDE